MGSMPYTEKNMTEEKNEQRSADSSTFAEFLREQLASLGHVTMRRMFGMAGVFCDGVMFGLVTEDTLASTRQPR